LVLVIFKKEEKEKEKTRMFYSISTLAPFFFKKIRKKILILYFSFYIWVHLIFLGKRLNWLWEQL